MPDFTTDVNVTMPKHTEEQGILLLDAYKLEQSRWHMEFCRTTIQEALETDRGQADREQLPQPKVDTSGWWTFGVDLGQQPPQRDKVMD